MQREPDWAGAARAEVCGKAPKVRAFATQQFEECRVFSVDLMRPKLQMQGSSGNVQVPVKPSGLQNTQAQDTPRIRRELQMYEVSPVPRSVDDVPLHGGSKASGAKPGARPKKAGTGPTLTEALLVC